MGLFPAGSKPEAEIPMRFVLFVGLATWMLSSGGLSFAQQSDATGAPRLRVPVTEVDLGDLTRIDRAEGRFEIRNEGSADLRILKAEPSCGCTVVSFDEVIPPGEKGYIDVVLDTKIVLGSLWSQIHVETNDPERAKLLLDVRARVFGAVRVLPVGDVFLYNRVGHLPWTSRLLSKHPDEEGELEVSEIEPSVDWLVARATKLEAPREAGGGLPEASAGDWILEVGVTGELDYGRSEQSIRFSTGLPREPVASVPVVLDLRPPVNLSTSEVVLSPRKPQETVVLSVREGADPSTLRVESDSEELRLVLEPAGVRFFKLHVTGSDALGDAGGTILFHVALETLRLPVRWDGS
jgi:hypothetical protein